MFQRVGAALRNDLSPECFLFVFSPKREMLRLHIATRKRSRENRVGCNGKLVPVDSGCDFMHTLIGETEDSVLNPFGGREPVQ